MERQFEELAKGLALGLSRRETLRRLGGFLGGCALASLGLEGRVWGQLSPGCLQLCRDTYPGRSKTARRNRRHCEWVCETQCGGSGGTCMTPAPSDGSPVTRCMCANGACPELGEVCCGSAPCPNDRCCGASGLCCGEGETCCFGTCCPTGRCCPGLQGTCCPEGTFCRSDPDTFEGTCVTCDPPCASGQVCCPDGRCHDGGQCCPCFNRNAPDAPAPAAWHGIPAGNVCCRVPCGVVFFCPGGSSCCTPWEPWVGPPEQNTGVRCRPYQCY